MTGAGALERNASTSGQARFAAGRRVPRPPLDRSTGRPADRRESLRSEVGRACASQLNAVPVPPRRRSLKIHAFPALFRTSRIAARRFRERPDGHAARTTPHGA